MNQSEIRENACNRRQARENACDQVTIGFSFASDWLKKWREFCQPITEPSNANPKQTPNYFRHSIENCSNQALLQKIYNIITHIPLTGQKKSSLTVHTPTVLCSYTHPPFCYTRRNTTRSCHCYEHLQHTKVHRAHSSHPVQHKQEIFYLSLQLLHRKYFRGDCLLTKANLFPLNSSLSQKQKHHLCSAR